MLTIPQRSETPSGTAYVAVGCGEPLVLIHGVGMKLDAWLPQIEALSECSEVIAADLPGHGGSAPLADGSDLKAFVSRFARFLTEIDRGPVSVAGHSMGALIAGGLGIEVPALVRRVALLNGVYRRDAVARNAVRQRAAEIGTGGFDREAPLRRWFGEGHEHEAAYALSRRLLAEVDQQGYATAYSAFANGDEVYADHWSEITCPALFLTGEGDLNSTPDMARAMAASTRLGKAVIVPGHRHMVNLTAPQAVNEALAEWMSWTTEEVRHDA